MSSGHFDSEAQRERRTERFHKPRAEKTCFLCRGRKTSVAMQLTLSASQRTMIKGQMPQRRQGLWVYKRILQKRNKTRQLRGVVRNIIETLRNRQSEKVREREKNTARAKHLRKIYPTHNQAINEQINCYLIKKTPICKKKIVLVRKF